MRARKEDSGRWVYCNEVADVAADAEADNQGIHDAELKKEEFNQARLWKILCRLSGIEKDIGKRGEGVPMTCAEIIAAAEAQVDGRRAERARRSKEKRTSYWMSVATGSDQ